MLHLIYKIIVILPPVQLIRTVKGAEGAGFAAKGYMQIYYPAASGRF